MLRSSVIATLFASGSMLPTASADDTALSRIVESIVRESLPQTFENDKHWDKREEVFSGFKVRSDGLNVRISKREKSVRHGFWRKYAVSLIDPERTFRLRINNVQPVGQGRFTFEVVADVRARVTARFEHWNYDVKLLNGSTQADASLRLRADCSLKWQIENNTDQGPTVVLDPDVVNVDLELNDLDVRKFGKLTASLAQVLGDGLTDAIEELLQTQEKSIRKQAWKEIDKHRDDLRLSLEQFAPWLSKEW